MILVIKPAAFRIMTGLVACALFGFSSMRASLADDKKITVEQLIANHLSSIGSAEARAAIKNRFVAGSVKLVSRVGNAGNLDGKGAMASASPKLRYTMRFAAPNYPSEQMAFDGERTSTSFLPEGKRSNLALFLDQQNLPLKEGLLCGTLSTSWALFRLEQQQPKLEYKGMSKVEGRQLHKVEYRQRKGSPGLKVTLYFDPQTFQHIRTEYRFQIAARIGLGPNDSNTTQESYYLLTEDFDDFRVVDGLTLPHKYKLQLSVNTSNGSIIYDWTLAVEQVSHKETFDDQTFTIK
jgi:hypothetical protein